MDLIKSPRCITAGLVVIVSHSAAKTRYGININLPTALCDITVKRVHDDSLPVPKVLNYSVEPQYYGRNPTQIHCE